MSVYFCWEMEIESSKIIPAELATGIAVVCVWEGER
jgi:hypothetical protein